MMMTLIGYRGTGKSSLAPLLAKSRGWKWIDADRELEHRTGRKIAEIFASSGEAAFREQEAALLQELYQQKNLVLATGGGAILNPVTCRLMRDSGPVIWLRADVGTILERMNCDATTSGSRPPLTSLPMREEIEQLLQKREPLYRQTSHLQVQTSGRDLKEIAEEIEAGLKLLPEEITREWSSC